jgi:serine/threonine protein kinase/peptidoglycan hydrolase-like protein with peptidoglycan-binding domain
VSADSDAGATINDFVSLRPDQLVGRYRIVSVLGQGSFGITYRALDGELGREVAIKEYLPAALAVRQDGTTVAPRSGSAAADFAWGRDRFIAEGRTLAAFHRLPGVVQVHDFLEANGTAYLVMELVRGRTLFEQIERQGPLDAAGLDGILSTLLDGLEQVHGVGFLHRDIKPANVLVDGQGRPVLIDFGASRAAVAGRSQAMTAIFTPGYAAVEQFTAATQGPWTDIYGLAATFHHAITGRAPPNAIDRIIDDTYAALADSGLPFLRTLLAGIDAGLAVRAADRPQSIAAWRKILYATPAGAGAAPATVVMPHAATPAASAVAASRKRPATMLAAGVAVLCLLAGGWFAIGSRPSGPASSESSSSASSSTASSSAGPASPSPSAPPTVAAAPAQDRVQEQLEEARRAQRAAFEEAARLRAEADARRKMDEEAALRRKIEEEMRQKAEAEEAARRRAVEDAKRQAAAETAAAAAARRQAESEARSKAEAEAAVRLKAEEADLKGAEGAEAALRLGQPDRQRIQAGLTALGFPTGGSDGMFGARSREMIAAWQKKAGRAATGYLSSDSQAALLREAAPALARHDEEQRKLAAAAQPQPAAPAKVATPCEGTYRVEWCRAAYQGFPPGCWNANATISNGVISGGWTSQGSTDRQTFSGSIDAGGDVRVTYNGVGQQTHVNRTFTVYMTGRVEGNVLRIAGRAGPNGRDFSATIQCR